MTETKRTFEKTVQLTDAELKPLINDKFGTLKLKDVPVGKHMVMRIDAPIDKRQYMDGDVERTSYSIKATHMLKNKKEVQLQVQIGQNCVENLEKKNPENSYVGMSAFFKQTKFKGNYPQFITTFKGEQRSTVSVDDLFGSDDESEGTLPHTDVEEHIVADDGKPKMTITFPTATRSFEDLIAREDVKTLVAACSSQGNNFAQAFADTVMIEGVGFHNRFKMWVDENTKQGSLKVQLTTPECEKLYGHILKEINK